MAPDRKMLTKKQRLEAAISDNVALCAAVCRTHGVASRFEDGLWHTLAPAPPYFPDLITTDASMTSARVAEILAERGSASVKDSSATLDLAPFGFEVLFRGEWIWLEPGSSAAASHLDWRRITVPHELDEWREAHGSADSILPALLAEPGLTVLQGRDDSGSEVGAMVSELAGPIGVSNVFANGLAMPAAWHKLVAHLRASWPKQPVVGYERGEELAAADAAGFEPIGHLQVWLKRA
jgi:hypothetical protein